MSSFNKVILMGNLTRDTELRFTPGRSAVCELGLAVNRKWKDQQGNAREEVTFVDVTLWGRTAEIANQYLAKGRPVHIEGRLQLEQWEDKNTGQKRSKLKVVGESLQLIGGGQTSGSRADTSQSADAGKSSLPDQVGSEFSEEDCPF